MHMRSRAGVFRTRYYLPLLWNAPPLPAKVPLSAPLHTPGCKVGGGVQGERTGKPSASRFAYFRAWSCSERTEAEGDGRRRWVGSRRAVRVGYQSLRTGTTPLISQHTGFLNEGERACACTHRRTLGLARAHGALAQPRHLPFPSEGNPPEAEPEEGGASEEEAEEKNCPQRLFSINR